MRGRWLAYVPITLGLLVLYTIASDSGMLAELSAPTVAATVDKHPIPMTAYKSMLIVTQNEYVAKNPKADVVHDHKIQYQIADDTIDTLIRDDIIDRTAIQYGIQVSQVEVQNQLAGLEQQEGGQAHFMQLVQAMGIGMSVIVESARYHVLETKVAQKLGNQDWLRQKLQEVHIEYYVGSRAKGALGQAPQIGYLAPDFALPTDGVGPAGALLASPTALLKPALLRGHPAVINFWASWCSGCIQEAPDMTWAGNTYGPKGVMFVGLDIQDKRPDAAAFLRRFHVPYLTAYDDQQGTVAAAYYVYTIPTTFFIDKYGVIRAIKIGPMDRATITRTLDALLKTS